MMKLITVATQSPHQTETSTQLETETRIMKDDYRDIYFFLIVGIVSLVVIILVGIYIEALPYL